MRRRTIKRRLRLSQLNDKHIDNIFRRMYGVRDKQTLRGEGQWLWVKAVRKAFRDQEKEDKKAGIKSFIKAPKMTFVESWEEFGEAWQSFVETISEELKNTFRRKKKDVKNNKEDATKRK